MNTTFINRVEDCTMIHMHKEQIKIVHAILPMAFLKSWVFNKHNSLYNAILIQCSQKHFIYTAHFASTERKTKQKTSCKPNPKCVYGYWAGILTGHFSRYVAHSTTLTRIMPLKINPFEMSHP